ncbi:hypothetical protein DWB58_28515 [candidate division KSB1 bacterium]|nr:hypothetical protein [candidate division KSB1 bacterium]
MPQKLRPSCLFVIVMRQRHQQSLQLRCGFVRVGNAIEFCFEQRQFIRESRDCFRLIFRLPHEYLTITL